MSKPEWSVLEVCIASLKGYKKNPRKMTDHQRKKLKECIETFGLIDKPIVNVDYTIIGGHQRVALMKELGFTTVPVWLPSRALSDAEVEELNVRHNQNTGSWDYDILANEFDFDKLMDWGFTTKHLLDEAEGSIKPKKAQAMLEFRTEAELGGCIEHLEQLALDWGCKLKIKVK